MYTSFAFLNFAGFVETPKIGLDPVPANDHSGRLHDVRRDNQLRRGWMVTDRTGYRYDPIDPKTLNAWPPLPNCFLDLAIAAATEGGYPEFRPDACLISRLEP